MRKLFVLLLTTLLVFVTAITGIACGDSDRNETGSADTTAPIISNITISDITETTAIISWDTDESATGNIEYSPTTSYDSSYPSPSDTTADETSHSLALSDLSPDTTYHLQVKSEDATDNEAISDDQTFTTSIGAIITWTIDITATDGTYSDKVRITWTNVGGATSYKVFRSTTNSSDTAVQIGIATVSPYDNTTAVVGTTYYYWVKATNASGDNAFSSSDPGWRAAVAPPTVSMEGDVDLDGYVTITDAMLINQFNAGLLILTDEQLQCADTTDDGIVSTADAMHISQWLVDPDGSLGELFKPLWESPADDSMFQPIPK